MEPPPPPKVIEKKPEVEVPKINENGDGVINDEEELDHVQAVNYAIHFGRNTDIYTKMELMVSCEHMPSN